MTRSRGTACLLVASLGCVSGVTAAPASPRFQVVPPDTKYVRRISVESALLSRFWGRPVVLRAVVLVPEGF